MKLLFSGDWHYTDKAPKTRTDDYVSEWFRKINILLKHDIIILQPGDLTDTPFLSYLAFRRLYSTLQTAKIFTIYGQHDLRYRNKGNTPLDALADACPNITIVRTYMLFPRLGKDIHLYGVSFGEEVPKTTKNSYNILMIHKMISPKAQQDWQEEEAHSFLAKNKFDLIVSGDNHKSFEAHFENRHLINCGSLMRSKIDQIDHKPCYYIFDTETKELEKHFIPITEGYKVFDVDTKAEVMQRNENMEAFVSGLSEQKEMGLNVMGNLMSYMAENKIGEDIQQIIKENSHAIESE